jgi:hypothetical protein
MQPASVSPEAMREHLVQQGFDPAIAAEAVELWQSLGSPADAHDSFGLSRDLGLPDDPRAMFLDELDELIAYHDSLCERFDEALARLAEVGAQIAAAMREHGSEVAGDREGRTPRLYLRPGPRPPSNATGVAAKSRPSLPTRSRC